MKTAFLTIMLSLSLGRALATVAPETIGDGTIVSPAVGPPPSYGIGGTGYTLVKNWHFGTDGTIKNNADLEANFQFHDQFKLDENYNYGARIVAPDQASAQKGQPYEGESINRVPVPAVRSFSADYMRTYLVPLGGVTTVTPACHKAGTIDCGSGSFQAKWTLPRGGSLLGRDMIWETRVRYVTPPYFWFAIWNAGNIWDQGAEMDLIESFGYDNTPKGGGKNFTGAFWHSNTVGGSDQLPYDDWEKDMKACGISNFKADEYHTWTVAYYKNNTYAIFVDGTKVQYGQAPYWWTVHTKKGGIPINMSFLFDGTWGSTTVKSVDHSLPASALKDCYYEWQYSRVYLR